MFGQYIGLDIHENGHIMDYSMDCLWTASWI